MNLILKLTEEMKYKFNEETSLKLYGKPKNKPKEFQIWNFNELTQVSRMNCMNCKAWTELLAKALSCLGIPSTRFFSFFPFFPFYFGCVAKTVLATSCRRGIKSHKTFQANLLTIFTDILAMPQRKCCQGSVQKCCPGFVANQTEQQTRMMKRKRQKEKKKRTARRQQQLWQWKHLTCYI